MQDKLLTVGMRSEGPDASLLHQAAVRGNDDTIEYLITSGADLNRRAQNGWTALHVAAAHNHPKIVDILLRSGAEAELALDNGHTALAMAVCNGHTKVVEELIRHGAEIDINSHGGRTPLHHSVQKGHCNIARQLLENGANIKAVINDEKLSVLHIAALGGRKDIINCLLDFGADVDCRDDRGHTALHYASLNGHRDCVEVLVSAGTAPDTKGTVIGDTPLMNAVTSDHVEVLRTLLRLGASLSAETTQGMSPVNLAARFGSIQCLQLLIEEGANLDAVDKNGYTALRHATEGRHEEAALLVIQSCSRINAACVSHQTTALHSAASHGSVHVVEALIGKGADIEALDADGDVPLQWAVEKGQLEVVQLLLRKGSQVNKQNPKTGVVVLQWAVTCGNVGMTEMLLAHGADASLVNTNDLKRRQGTDEESFNECKLLMEAWNMSLTQSSLEPKPNLLSDHIDMCRNSQMDNLQLVSTENHPPPDPKTLRSRQLDDSPKINPRLGIALPQSRSGNLEMPNDAPDHVHKINVKTEDSQFSIRHSTYEMPDHAAAIEALGHLVEHVEHQGVRCDGPLCKDKVTWLTGERYKCSSCKNVDFCSHCIGSFHNNHDARHAMIKCLLPTKCYLVAELDDHVKKQWLEQCADTTLSTEDLCHGVLAETDSRFLDQAIHKLNGEENNAYPVLSKLKQSPPQFFLVCNGEQVVSLAQDMTAKGKSKFISFEEEDEEKRPSVTCYKIDERFNVRAKNFPIGSSKPIPKEEEHGVLHYQSPEILAGVLTGKLTYYDYSCDKEFYELANQGRQATRVIDIAPGKFEDKIDLRLRTIDVGRMPAYQALSYTWKETAYERAHIEHWKPEEDATMRKMQKVEHGVYCKDESGRDHFITVSAGLRDALRRLRDVTVKKTFWIDQLSINQKDLSERTYQVQGMTKIYNYAQNVVLWSGDEDQYTKDVFCIYERIAKLTSSKALVPSPEAVIQSEGMQTLGFDSPTWKAAIEFYWRPVWSRSWVIQEVVVGRSVIVRCGDLTISWKDFVSAAFTFIQPQWLNRFQSLHDPSPTDPSVGSGGRDRSQGGPIPDVISINGLREDFQTLKTNRLDLLLYTTNRYAATDPRDRIYSILGIRSAGPNFEASINITPDYTKAVRDVYIEAAKVCITESSALTICGLCSSLATKQIDDLPSWVPDFSQTLHGSNRAYSRPAPQCPYNACGVKSLNASWPFETRSDLLVVTSRSIDRVAAVSKLEYSTPENTGTVIAEWAAMASGAAMRHFKTGSASEAATPHSPADCVPEAAMQGSTANSALEAPMRKLTAVSAFEAFWRTCAADSNGQWRQVPAPDLYGPNLSVFFLEHFTHYATQDCNSSADIPARFSQVGSDIILAMAETAQETFSDDWKSFNLGTLWQTSDVFREAFLALELACRGRKFFVTEKGLFGLGPPDTLVSDEVHVISGTKVPFVLRHVEDEDGDEGDNSKSEEALALALSCEMDLYRMIGETFVYGIMYGEAERMDREWKNICIH